MTLSASVLEKLVIKARRKFEQAAAAVGNAAHALAQGRQTFDTLETFVAERTAARRRQVGRSVDASELARETRFAQKLGVAVQSQHQTVENLEQARRTQIETMMAAKQALSTMESLQERKHNQQVAERRRADLRRVEELVSSRHTIQKSKR